MMKVPRTMVWWMFAPALCPLLTVQGGVPQNKKLPGEQKLVERVEPGSPRKNIITEAEAHYLIGTAYLREPQNTGQAVEYLEKAVLLDGNNAEYHFRLAEAYMADFPFAGLFRKPFVAARVKSELELAVKYDPLSPTYREGLIQYLVEAPAIFGGSFAEAHDHANAIRRVDQYRGTLADAGIYGEEGELEKAEQLFRKAIRMRPSSWMGYQRLGEYYMNLRKVDKAIVQFKKYIEVAPDLADGFEKLGQAYTRRRLYDEAIEAYQAAIRKDPSLVSLFFRIAQLYEFKDARQEALRHYERYLAVVPHGPIASDARLKIQQLSRLN